MSAPQKFRLGDVLIVEGLITQEQLGEALAEQKKSGRKLGRVLSDLGFVGEDKISEVVAQQMKIPFIDLRKREVDADLVRRLPEAQARRFRAIVLDERDGVLLVGFSDPTDIFAQDEVTRLLRVAVKPVAVTERLLLAAIDRIYQRREEMAELAIEVAADIAQAAPLRATLDFGSSSDDAPIVRLLNSIFETAIAQSVSDVHIEPQEKNVVIRLRIEPSFS